MTTRVTFTQAELERAAKVALKLGACAVVRKSGNDVEIEIRPHQAPTPEILDTTGQPKQW